MREKSPAQRDDFTPEGVTLYKHYVAKLIPTCLSNYL